MRCCVHHAAASLSISSILRSCSCKPRSTAKCLMIHLTSHLSLLVYHSLIIIISSSLSRITRAHLLFSPSTTRRRHHHSPVRASSQASAVSESIQPAHVIHNTHHTHMSAPLETRVRDATLTNKHDDDSSLHCPRALQTRNERHTPARESSSQSPSAARQHQASSALVQYQDSRAYSRLSLYIHAHDTRTIIA